MEEKDHSKKNERKGKCGEKIKEDWRKICRGMYKVFITHSFSRFF